MRNILTQAAKDLYPGYFALVMATGILSIDASLWEWNRVGGFLFRINQIAYAVLWILTLVRLTGFLSSFTADLINHRRGSGFFTIVAGTCVLGSQFMILSRDPAMGTFLWILGVLIWVLVMYSFFPGVMTRKEKPNLQEGLTGGWLISVVGTQSISILAALIAPFWSSLHELLLFFALAWFLLGGMLYIFIIPLIFYRLAFFPLTPEEFSPLYWINMGALAITTLTGATLILSSPQWPFLQEILPFLKGFTLFFWITGTWWIPLLAILMAWRHQFRKFPLRYTPEYWGMVFPLGMYSAGTHQLAKAAGLPFLFPLAQCFFYLALITWFFAFLGLLRRLARLGD